MGNKVSKIPKVDVTQEEISLALETMKRVRNLSKGNSRYGFNDDFDTFIMKMMCLTPQSYGARIQKYLIERFGFETIPPKDDAGDLKDQTGEHWELKASIITSTNTALNMVQIRPWQDIYGYYCIAIDTRVSPFKETIFALSKSQMNQELEAMKATSAHGTKTATANNDNVELRLSLNINPDDSNYQRWIETYLKKRMTLNKDRKEDPKK